MKKLVLLGGLRYLLPVIRKAHELGLYVITCDNVPENPAHRCADESCNVSIIDPEATLRAVERLGADGIMSFGCDPGVLTAAYIADRLGMPSCGPLESVRILQNKGAFRRFLASHGFNTPAAKTYRSAKHALADAEAFHWPVIVKPVDSAGSKGVCLAECPRDLNRCAETALACSHSRAFIVEDYIPGDIPPSDSDCFSVDGTLAFTSFSAQWFDQSAENPYVPAAYSWPAALSAAHQSELTAEIQRLLYLLRMGTSLYNIESRVGYDGKAYIMECSPRGGGNRLSECLEFATGVKLVENAVRAAVGMPLTDIAPAASDGFWAEIILHSDRPGVFRELHISRHIEGDVFERDLWVEPGDRIGGFRAANETIGTLVLRFPSAAAMRGVMERIGDFVRVIVA